MRRDRTIFGAALASAALFAAMPVPMARAQSPSGGEKVTAEALFEDGRRLVAEGKFADACPKFQASERLDPSAGTLLNLASCFEKQGRTAAAWGTYKEAASAADAAGRKDYVATAQRRAEALAPKLARLTVSVEQPVDGIQIRRDGTLVDRAEWGVPIPVDKGSHTIEASAPGHKGWASAIAVGQDGAQAALSVPALEPAPQDTATPAPPLVAPPVVAPPAGQASTAPVERGSTGTQRAIGIVIAGLGVVGVGLGAVFGLEAKGKYNDSLGNCETSNPDLCNSTGLSQRDSARSAGNVSTVAFGVGAAALVGGAVLWLTAPSSASHASGFNAFVAPALGGAVVRGAW
jgi:hypothetical protein